MSFWWDGEGTRYFFKEVFKAGVILLFGLPVFLFLIFLLLMAILTT